MATPLKDGFYVLSVRRQDRRWLWSNLEKWKCLRIVLEVVGSDKFFWRSHTEIETKNGVLVRCEFLEDVMDYDLTADEKAADLGVPLGDDVARAAGREHRSLPVRTVLEPRNDEEVSLADVAKSVKLTPREARAILRRLKIPKPYRWGATEAHEIAARLERRK